MIRIDESIKVQSQSTPDAKPPLPYETLRDVIDLALWAGQMLLQNGAESLQVEETVHRLGTGLGCDWLEIFISPNAIVITAISHGEFRTKLRRVVNVGANFLIVTEINTLVNRVLNGERDRAWLRGELARISQLQPVYPRWVTAVMVGVACGAFSQLFGGDITIFAVTTIASTIAQWIRQSLQRGLFNAYFVVAVTAFTAGAIAGLAEVFHLGNQPQLALASAVLLLVPGVPLINSIQDLIKGLRSPASRAASPPY